MTRTWYSPGAVLCVLMALAAGGRSASAEINVYAWGNFTGQPGGSGNADGTGSAARFNEPGGAAVDSAGNLYVADTYNHTIRKIPPPGAVTTLAGLAGSSGSADGTGSAARFNDPGGVAADTAGNVYVADTYNHTIRKVTPAGVVTTLAGLAGVSGSADGTGGAARFYYPRGVAVDTTGNVYVADAYNYTIRKVTAAGVVTTLAGLAGTSGSADGAGSAARFYQPGGVAVDSANNVYVADTYNHTIRRVTPAGLVTTLAGLAGSPGSADGTGSAARFYYPYGVAVDGSGHVYVADTDNHTVRKVTPSGAVTTLAGTAGSSGSADGTGSAARFYYPYGMAVDGESNLYVADTYNHTIRRVAPSGVVTTLAGQAGSSGSADGTGSAARFYQPGGVALDSEGNLYVADSGNSTIRKVTPDGVVTTVAGLARSYGSTDGTGSAARFNYPSGIALDSAGNVYVADTYNHTVRKMTPAGVVTTLAGFARYAGSADGTGNAARFNYPCGVAVDGEGNVFVADTYNHTIRKVTPDGVVTTPVGLTMSYGSADGTGSAARLYYPRGVAVDRAGNLYVADAYNHTIRKVTPDTVVTTLAGLAGSAGSADGTGSAARFYYPYGVAVDSAGSLYVADLGNCTIRKVTPTGAVTTIGGTAGVVGGADGAGTAGTFDDPAGITVDRAGYLYVADTWNNRISNGTAPLIDTASPLPAATVGAAYSQTLAATGGTGSYAWSILSGNLPADLGLSSDGLISGTPGEASSASFIVQVADSNGASSTAPFSLAVYAPPTVSVPVITGGAIHSAGDTVTLAESASGTGGLSYQWYRIAASVGTDNPLIITNVQCSESGSYTCQVTDAATGLSSTSEAVILTVNPTITNPSGTTTLTAGDTLNLSVTGAGSSTLSYQWYKDSAPVGSAGSSGMLIVDPVQTTDGGAYYAVVTDAATGNQATSGSVAVTVSAQPAVGFSSAAGSGPESMSPVAIPVVLSASSTLTTTVSYAVTGGTAVAGIDYALADGTLTFIPGETSQNIVLTILNNGLSSPDHTVVLSLSDPTNAILGANITYTYTILDNQAPNISAGSDQMIVLPASSVTLSGTADDDGRLSLLVYTWSQLSGPASVTFEDANALSTIASGLNLVGSYVLQLAAYDGEFTTTSTVTITVNQPPTIITQPVDQSVTAGQSLLLTVLAGGSGTLSYQWCKDTMPLIDDGRISGSTTSSLTITSVTADDGGRYDCVVTSSYGSATSDAATIAILLPPGVPGDPTPATGQVDVSTGTGLSWSGADTGVTFDVYLDTVNPPVVQVAAGLADAVFSPSTLLLGTRYYWRVVAVNSSGQTQGPIWTFATHLTADIDGDGAVILADLKLLVAAWNSTPTQGNWNPAADVDGDGAVILADLKILVANWNRSVN